MARQLLGQLYIQVLIGICIGIIAGLMVPDFANKLQPLADGFIKLIKMLLAPVIFATVVLGIAKMGDIKEVGKTGARALIYFEVATLSSFPAIPIAGLVLLLGVDRFMNEARAVVNLIGNGVATIAFAKWEGALDQATVEAVIAGQRGDIPRNITAPGEALGVQH